MQLESARKPLCRRAVEYGCATVYGAHPAAHRGFKLHVTHWRPVPVVTGLFARRSR